MSAPIRRIKVHDHVTKGGRKVPVYLSVLEKLTDCVYLVKKPSKRALCKRLAGHPTREPFQVVHATGSALAVGHDLDALRDFAVSVWSIDSLRLALLQPVGEPDTQEKAHKRWYAAVSRLGPGFREHMSAYRRSLQAEAPE